jgi:MFS family permease
MTKVRKAGSRAVVSLQERAARTFTSLGVRNYRLYFIGQTISLCGTWMQSVAQGVLVLNLTKNNLVILGLVVALQQLPVLLFASYGGLLADRFSKRKMLYVTQTVAGLLALTLGVLVLGGWVRLWMVFVLAGGLGLVNAMDNPARQTFVFDMVGRSQLTNAVTLNSIIVNLSRVIGPALAVVIIAQVGLAPCFIINALSFGAVLSCLVMMDGSKLHQGEPAKREKGQLRAGFHYAWNTTVLRDVLLMMALVGTLTYEFMVSIPGMARVTLLSGDAGYGALVAAMGAGAVVGGLVTAGRRSSTMSALTIGSFGFGLSTALFALSPSLVTASLAVAVVGFFSVWFTSLTNAILQLSSAPQMRGRVMALWSMAFLGSTVIGAPIIGWVSQVAGPPAGLGVGAVAALLAGGIGLSAMRVRENAVVELPVPMVVALEEDESA